MNEEIIDSISVTVRTGGGAETSARGRVYLGATGREFALETGADDFAQGAVTTFVMGGSQPNVRNEADNDPRDPQLLVRDLLRCPVYIRFVPVGSWDVLRLEQVDLSVRDDQGGTWNYQILADREGTQESLQLGALSGQVIHLRPQGATVVDLPISTPQVLVHSASGLVITPRGHEQKAGTEVRLWSAGLPARGVNSGVQGKDRGRIWQFEPADAGGVRIKNGLGFYLTTSQGREPATVKMDTERSGDQGQVWHLEQPTPHLADFVITSALNRELAIGPLEVSHLIENVLVLRGKTSLDQLWTSRTPATSKPNDA
ncbi:hypothetical protein [Streptomyces flavidovirens]|uniref:hypothetical protein n=1 Tax=Streptomyces flavidovirens TaxID=67298 RepID=UPI00368DFB96